MRAKSLSICENERQPLSRAKVHEVTFANYSDWLAFLNQLLSFAMFATFFIPEGTTSSVTANLKPMKPKPYPSATIRFTPVGQDAPRLPCKRHGAADRTRIVTPQGPGGKPSGGRLRQGMPTQHCKIAMTSDHRTSQGTPRTVDAYSVLPFLGVKATTNLVRGT